MLQIVKRSSIFVLIALTAWVIVRAEGQAPPLSEDVPLERLPYLENLLFQSSRFNQPDDLSLVPPEHIIPILETDEQVLENDQFVLYMNPETLNFKVENKVNGYVFATAIDEPDAGTFTPLLSSGVGLDYINLQTNYSLRQNVGLVDTEFVIEKQVVDNRVELTVYVGGFCTRRICQQNYPRYLEGDFTLEQMINFGLVEIGIRFELHVTLTETGLTAHIPFESIEESYPERIRLASLILFPGMGATHMDDIPGYMVIPDGVGALIRYEDNQGRFLVPFEERFYGGNQGIVTTRRSVTSYPLSMPVFGAVHGVKQHAYLGVIASGDTNARLFAYPNGAANIPYNIMYTKFDFNQTFRQSFSSDGTGGAMRIHTASKDDVTVHYKFLADERADYVGLARTYQQYLVGLGHLTPQTPASGPIPIHLQVLMADSQSTFIGTRQVEMTSLEGLRTMVDTFMTAGLSNQTISLLGWNRGGYSGHLPAAVNFERSIGSKRAFEETLHGIQEDGHRVLLVNNYQTATEATSNITTRSDVAEGVNRFKLTRTCDTCVYTDRHLLYPSTSVRLASDHLEDYRALGVEVLFENIANRLFSYHQRNSYTRSDALRHYTDIYTMYEDIGHYASPMAYAFPYMRDYFDAALFNSQLAYFSDLVPFKPIVLSGHVSMFSQFLNFNSLGITPLLMMIDFGIYPAYILTENRSSLLRGTDIEALYATQFSMWQDQIIEEYQFVNEALQAVQGASIVARTVPDIGLSQVTYDNGVILLVNYTSTIQVIDGVAVEPQQVVVREVSP